MTHVFFARLRKQLRLTRRTASATVDLFSRDAWLIFCAWGLPSIRNKRKVPNKIRANLLPPTVKKLVEEYNIMWLEDGITFSSATHITPDLPSLRLTYSGQSKVARLSLSYRVFNSNNREQQLDKMREE